MAHQDYWGAQEKQIVSLPRCIFQENVESQTARGRFDPFCAGCFEHPALRFWAIRSAKFSKGYSKPNCLRSNDPETLSISDISRDHGTRPPMYDCQKIVCIFCVVLSDYEEVGSLSSLQSAFWGGPSERFAEFELLNHFYLSLQRKIRYICFFFQGFDSSLFKICLNSVLSDLVHSHKLV